MSVYENHLSYKTKQKNLLRSKTQSFLRYFLVELEIFKNLNLEYSQDRRYINLQNLFTQLSKLEK